MFSGRDRFRQRRDPLHRRRSVEEYGITRIRQGRIEIRRPAINSVCARERGEASIVTAGQKQMRHDPIVSDGQPTLCADRQQRIRQMLRRSDTAG